MRKIFITGAAGFVGSRLVEIMKEQQNTELNVLLRSISRAARISRYKLNYFQGTITDEQVLDKAISGCDAVVHCAHDFSSDAINLEAADIISRLCLKHGVKRLIYISTSAVHLSNNQQVMNENSPLNHAWDYSANKLQVESRFLEFYKTQNLPVIILRPSVIYGPFAGVWTNGLVKEMMDRRIILPFGGLRVCNAVYIDDVVEAIIKAMHAEKESTGRAYLVSGSEKLTWKEFFKAYETYPGVQAPVYWNDDESASWYAQLEKQPQLEVKPTMSKDPISFMKSNFLYKLYQQLLKNKYLKEKLLAAKEKVPRPLKYPSAETFETFGCTAQIDLAESKNRLGFIPQYNLEKGMKKTRIYLDWYNLNAN
jgi:nucleoside-diphosphate-sugar epimerase